MDSRSRYTDIRLMISNALNMKKCTTYFATLVLASLLSGCGISTFRLSPEEKINAAFPMPEPVSKSIVALLDSIKPEKRAEIQAQLADRIKRRAVTCAKGYAPSWYSTLDSVRKALNAEACFTESDAGLAQWVGIRRAAVVLATPVVPTTAKLPASILTTDPIMFLNVAQNASVAIAISSLSFEILDLETGKSVHKEPTKSFENILPSPNGKLFSRKIGDKVTISLAKTGETLFELPAPYQQVRDFHWIDDHAAVWNEKESPVLIDFASGTKTPIDNFRLGVRKAVAMPGEPDTYVFLGGYRVAKAAFDRANQSLRLIAEKTWGSDLKGWDVSSAVTADGMAVVHGGSRSLSVLSLTTIETEEVDFAPFTIYQVRPTPDPDQLLLVIGAVGSSAYNSAIKTPLVRYSSGTRNTAMVDIGTVSPIQSYPHHEYVPSLKRNVLFGGKTILLPDDIPVKEVVPFAILKYDTQNIIQQRTAEHEYEVAHRTDADRARIKRERDRNDEEIRRYVPEYRRIPNDDVPTSRSSGSVIEQYRERILEQYKIRK